MVPFLVLSLALGVGQTESPAGEPAAAPPASPDRWAVMQSLQGTYPGWLLDGNRLRVSGWTNGSYTASTAARDNLPLGLNYRANEFLLQQNWLRFERTVVTTETTEPTFGFRVDAILPGTDYRFTLPRGLWNSQLTANNGEPATYGVDPVQYYLEAYFPTIGAGLDLKLGRTFCQFGVETIDAVSNQLASHSYSFFYNPFTNTGLIATQQLSSTWTVQVGAVLGPDVVIDPAASPYGMFSVKWAPPGGRDTIYIAGLLGSGRYDVAQQFNNPNVVDFIYTHVLDPATNYTLEAVIGYEDNVPGIGTATWYGVVNYLTRTLSPRLTGTTRVEFFDDVDGNRTGFEGVYTAVTAGLRFEPRPGFIIRPELRFDYNFESKPFEDKHGMGTATTDFIVRW
ncbi:MAG: porin [Gemmataceae bacterium]|nr:porin [Gemmataceae bacterium]